MVKLTGEERFLCISVPPQRHWLKPHLLESIPSLLYSVITLCSDLCFDCWPPVHRLPGFVSRSYSYML